MPTPADQTGPYDKRLVGWLSLAQLITWGSVFYGFAVLMEPLERDLGLSRVQSSLAFSLALLAEGVLAYPVGRLIDRGHERIVMTGASLLIAVCLFAHGFVTGVAGLYSVWIGLGLGLAGTLYTPVFAVVTRRFPHDFRRAIITLTFLGGLASTVFIPLVAWLIAALGWRHAVWVLAALHLLVCAPLHARWLRGAPRSTTLAALAGTAPAPASRHFFQAPFLLVGVFIIAMMGVTAALPPHMLSLLRESGLSEAWVIAIPAAIGAVQVLGRLLLYFFERRFDVHVANRVIPCLIPISLAVLLMIKGWPVAALVFVLLYGLGNGMLTIVKGTAIAQYVSRTHVAALNGALGVPTALARALAPLLLGVLWSQQAGYTAGLWVLLGVSVVAVLALLLAQHAAQRRREVPASAL